MKLDKFLAALFSKKVLIIALVLLLLLCFTACTAEDVICLLFCGCPTPETTCNCIDSICSATCNGIKSCVQGCIDATYGRVCDCILEPMTKNSCTESYYGAN